MKLCVSNLAWDNQHMAEALDILGEHAIEIAPTKIWPDLTAATPAALTEFRRRAEDAGVGIVALQSLLFGLKDVNVFEPTTWPTLLERLRTVSSIAATLGARGMVFGSPNQRRRADRPNAIETAREFFGRAAEVARAFDVSLLMEANPAAYNCDFVQRTEEAAALVDLVDHPNFGLHLDTGCTELAGEDPRQVFPRFAGRARHLHLSRPKLAPPDAPALEHFRALAARLPDYEGYYSFEYLAPPEGQMAALRLAASL